MSSLFQIDRALPTVSARLAAVRWPNSSAGRGTAICMASLLPGLLLSMTTDSARAEAWKTEIGVGVDTIYDDNPLLLPNDGDSVFGGTISPDIGIKGDFGTVTLGFDADATGTQYNGDGNALTDDKNIKTLGYHLGTSLLFKGRRSQFTAGIDYRNLSTRESELEDTGLVVIDSRRQTVSGNAGLKYELSRLDNLSMSVTAEDGRYDTDLLTGYRSYGANLGYGRELTRTDEIGLTVGLKRIDPDSAVTGVTDIYRAGLTWAHSQGETLSFNMEVGGSYAKIAGTGGAPDERERGMYASAKGLWSITQLDSLSMSYEKSLTASGLGEVQDRDTARLSYLHGFTRRLSFTLPISGIRQDYATGTTPDERRYFDVAPSLSWNFLPDWSLSGTYRYRWQKFESQPDAAVSNAGLLSLAYRTNLF